MNDEIKNIKYKHLIISKRGFPYEEVKRHWCDEVIETPDGFICKNFRKGLDAKEAFISKSAILEVIKNLPVNLDKNVEL